MANLEQEGFQEGFPVPDDIVLTKILSKLELDSLCSLSCVCRSFPSLVDQVIPILPTLNLSAFSPNRELLDKIIPKLRGIKSITFDCLQLSARSIAQIFKPHIEELTLLKCGLPDDYVLSIGYRCPNLRILNLELVWENALFKEQLIKRLEQFLYLECLSIKLLGTESDPIIGFTRLILPKTIKTLKWQQVGDRYTSQFITNQVNSDASPHLGFSGLQRLSLVLNELTDRLIRTITSSLPLLVELELEDRPFSYPELPDDDLTNDALKSLGLCPLLSSLSIVRSRARNPVACFFRVNNLGMSLLSSGCEALESIILGGFIKVTGVGFSSFLHSCPNLKKFEVRDAPLLTDLAFHNNNTGVVCHLVELKLVSCNHITSETLSELASSTTLELLDMNGCFSIADPCLDYVSRLSNTLRTLNLGRSNITDTGLNVLSKGDLPLVSLCLRGCRGVSEKGIISLFEKGQKMKKTLTSLDIGHMPCVSDRAIHAIFLNAESISELCMKFCFYVTDASFEKLASERRDGKSLLRKLDLSHCKSFSGGVDKLFERPFFRGLRWLGVGHTCFDKKKDDFVAIKGMRPWLMVCYQGCEIGCEDGWQFHKGRFYKIHKSNVRLS